MELTPEERAHVAKYLADQHQLLSEHIHEWARGDYTDFCHPADEVLLDRGNCDDLAAFLMERGWGE